MARREFRWLAAIALAGALLLGGCSLQTDATGAPVGVSASLATPAAPLTYRWVMVHAGDAWGVQIGPKSDGSGFHVAVYGWRDCSSTCGWEYFEEFDELEPGSVHRYAIARAADGWHLSVDGRDVVVLDPGGPAGGVAASSVNGEETKA